MLNTDKIKEKLIDLFANHPAAEIEKNSGKLLKDTVGVGKYRKLSGDREFQDYFETLTELRDDLDDVLEGEKGIRQVKNCLFWLNGKKKDAEKKENNEYFRLAEELVKRGIYLKTWDKEHQAYFDTGIEMMKEWKDFFLSYTNRNFHETNNDFEGIISRVLEPDVYKDNKNNSNCVARLIFHYLDKHGLKCFFDKRSLTCGDVLENNIFKHCVSVFVFVQLVELETFNYRDDKTNWCYEEFKKFDLWVNENNPGQLKRYQFVLTGDEEEIFPANLHGSYEDWRDKIKGRVYIGNLGNLSIKQVRRKMFELAGEIKDTRNRMLEDYYS